MSSTKDDTVIYLDEINNWSPTVEESEFLNYLDDCSLDEMFKNQICVGVEVVDQSESFYVTCKKGWLFDNFPQMKEYITEFKTGYHKEWKPENYGYSTIDIYDKK